MADGRPGSLCPFACTCTFAAPPYPPTALFTCEGAYSVASSPASPQTPSATPRACPSRIAERGFR